ncbi:MAG: glutamate racemase [Thiohalocapsa sp.]|uniref:glutamate racemase n=1 Tax=Thiohalocapsa sp. TaxID=2497641 RepID=UPI0025DC8CBA|nr:glutamate racemase [Thiohalocapsa sp.]MCG6942120.1 glutamate racemase [Thiohalocapsa sp.]
MVGTDTEASSPGAGDEVRAAAAAGPIGVFDSGVGGLTVLAEIRRALPAEHLLYVADSGHAPYGDRPNAAVRARAEAITGFLIERGAKAIVIACNTATGVAAAHLRALHDLPIIAMEPALKPAAACTRSGVVGVLATSGTLKSEKFEALRGRFHGAVEVLTQPCPGLVELIEAGDFADEALRCLLADLVLPLTQRGADTLVLGCTHYPLVRALIADIAGPDVTITDTGVAVARQVQNRLAAAGLLRDAPLPRGRPGSLGFWTSAPSPNAAAVLIQRIWGEGVPVEPLPC